MTSHQCLLEMIQPKINVNTISPSKSFNQPSFSGQNKETTSLPKYIAGGVAGYGINAGTQALYNNLHKNALIKLVKGFPAVFSEKEAIPLFKKMLSDNNLKNVKLTYISNDQLKQGVIRGYQKSKPFKIFDNLPGFLKPLGKKINQSKINALSKIKNTGDYFSEVTNKIRINKDHLNCGFHEIGHAKDHYGKGFKAFLSKVCEPLAFYGKKYIVPAMLLTALTYKKSDNKEEANILKKTRAFIHDNIGKLTFAIGIPTIMNEFSASKNAIDFLKQAKNVTPNAIKLINLRQCIGFGAHTMLFVGLALTAKLGVMVRDKITKQA